MVSWTLTEAARILRQPQYKLIYLCEKGAVTPDFADAKGRGSSRLFSARNLLELAVALKLREFLIPVSLIGAILHVLRQFEKKVAQRIQGFSIPEGLTRTASPDLRIIVIDGRELFLSLGVGKRAPRLYGGIDFRALAASTAPRRRGSRRPAPDKSSLPFTQPAANRLPEGQARFEISVTRIARDLSLEE